MTDGLLLLIPWLVPLLAAALAATPSWSRVGIVITPWAALPGLIVALAAGPGLAVEVPWLMVGSRFEIDEIGRIFLLFTSAAWMSSGRFAVDYFAADPARRRFHAFFLLTMAGNLGVVLAGDMVTFYSFFALMSFGAYPLVIHDRARESLLAGRIYMAFVVGGEALLFLGLVGLAGVAGGTSFQEVHRAASSTASFQPLFTLVLIGFAIKTAAVPLHAWLPVAHPAAPVPASAVLSGPMLKAGLLGWLRFLPLGETSFEALGTLSIVGGLVSVFWGVAAGLMQRDPKATLGYSSLSQMGLLLTAVGAGLLAPDAWPALLSAIALYAFHHATSKAALFLGTGAVRAGGVPPAVAFVGLVIPAAALAGAPLTSGAVAKIALKGSLAIGFLSAAALDALLSAAAVGTTLLMIRFLVLATKRPIGTTRPVPRASLIAWLTLVVGSQTSIWLLPWTGFRGEAPGSLSPGYLWAATWPLLAGIGAAWLVWAWPRAATALARLHVRPGDVLWLFASGLTAARQAAAAARPSRPDFAVSKAGRTRHVGHRALRRLRDAERAVQWPLVAMFVMFVVSVLTSLLSP